MKINLRQVTIEQNNRNRVKASREATTRYKGVSRSKATGRFIAKIQGKQIGTYATATEAAKAYDKKAVEVYGEYAKLNFLASWEKYAV